VIVLTPNEAMLLDMKKLRVVGRFYHEMENDDYYPQILTKNSKGQLVVYLTDGEDVIAQQLDAKTYSLKLLKRLNAKLKNETVIRFMGFASYNTKLISPDERFLQLSDYSFDELYTVDYKTMKYHYSKFMFSDPRKGLTLTVDANIDEGKITLNQLDLETPTTTLQNIQLISVC
jgi:hypothetical protein